jgi:hypothetical protein
VAKFEKINLITLVVNILERKLYYAVRISFFQIMQQNKIGESKIIIVLKFVKFCPAFSPARVFVKRQWIKAPFTRAFCKS